MIIVQRNGDNHPRFKAPAGAAHAHAAFLAEGVEGAVKAVDLPAAERQLAQPGDNGDGDESGDHISSLIAGRRFACPAYD
ncbi:hypothetical protein D3C76_1389480 [compost metagenome]